MSTTDELIRELKSFRSWLENPVNEEYLEKVDRDSKSGKFVSKSKSKGKGKSKNKSKASKSMSESDSDSQQPESSEEEEPKKKKQPRKTNKRKQEPGTKEQEIQETIVNDRGKKKKQQIVVEAVAKPKQEPTQADNSTPLADKKEATTKKARGALF